MGPFILSGFRRYSQQLYVDDRACCTLLVPNDLLSVVRLGDLASALTVSVS